MQRKKETNKNSSSNSFKMKSLKLKHHKNKKKIKTLKIFRKISIVGVLMNLRAFKILVITKMMDPWLVPIKVKKR